MMPRVDNTSNELPLIMRPCFLHVREVKLVSPVYSVNICSSSTVNRVTLSMLSAWLSRCQTEELKLPGL